MAQKDPIAVVQDYLCAYAGGERVALSIARVLDAPLYTSLYDPGRTFPADGVRIHASPISRLRMLRADHRRALPLLAPTFSAMKVDADVTICTTAGWSHGARTTGRKVAYWESPAKWLHRPGDYQAAGSRIGKLALGVLRRPLLRWDAKAVESVDQHLANSTFTRDLLQRIYGVQAEVVPCPHDFSPVGPQAPVPGADQGFLLCVCRLLPYKNVDAVVRAMRQLPAERLLVVGIGPEEARLKAAAPRNVTFLGSVAEASLRWLYANCAALVTASREDFGLTPLEADSFGRPTAALRYGGFLDTVIPGQTGVLFDDAWPDSIAASLAELLSGRWDSTLIREHAEQFSPEAFAVRLRETVAL